MLVLRLLTTRNSFTRLKHTFWAHCRPHYLENKAIKNGLKITNSTKMVMAIRIAFLISDANLYDWHLLISYLYENEKAWWLSWSYVRWFRGPVHSFELAELRPLSIRLAVKAETDFIFRPISITLGWYIKNKIKVTQLLWREKRHMENKQ